MKKEIIGTVVDEEEGCYCGDFIEYYVTHGDEFLTFGEIIKEFTGKRVKITIEEIK